MDKATLILLSVVLILGGVLGYVYFTQQEKISNPDTSILTVSAESNGKKVMTGFRVNGEEFNTSTVGYTLVKVPVGYLVTIESFNLDGQSFYKEISEVNITENVIRHDILLTELKSVTIEKSEGNPINLTVYSEDYRDLHFCLSWSLSYIFVKSNYTEIDKPNEFKNWDRCYKTDLSLKESSIEIPISFQELGIPKERDYINISFFNPNLITKQTTIKIK